MERLSKTLYCYRILKRREARKEVVMHYYTGKPCVHGHDALRLTSTGECVVCGPIRRQRWMEKGNREASNAKMRERNRRSAETFTHLSKTDLKKYLGWLEATGFIESKGSALKNKHPYYRTGEICWNNHYSVFSTRSYKNKCLHCKREETLNKPKVKNPRTDAQRAKTRETTKTWAANNPEKYAWMRTKQNIFRHKRLRDATPKWLTAEQKDTMQQIYKERDFLKEQTGQDYHVDHIIPIRNKIVCGLHVPWNLRVVSKEVNKTKANKYEGEYVS